MVESLMVALVLMVGETFIERAVQGTFAEENQLVETLFSSSEIVCNRIQILLPALRYAPCAEQH